MKFKNLLFSLLLLASFESSGQDSTGYSAFRDRFDKAKTFHSVSLFAQALAELDVLIEIARDRNWKRDEVEAIIFKAEIKRKLADIDEGFQLLRNLDDSEQFPDLEVKKLGRMAALINEGAYVKYPDANPTDSVKHYLNKAIEMAKVLNLTAEQAGLYNELGYTLRTEDLDSSLYYLKAGAALFLAVGDTQNYIATRTNELRNYVNTSDSANIMATFNELHNLLQGRGWYRIEINFYQVIVNHYFNTGDTLLMDRWQMKLYESMFQLTDYVNASQIFSYRTLYETQKYQDEVAEKAQQLEKETRRRKELFVYLGIAAFFSLLIGFLLFRERSLKRAVNKANDRYHLLLVESNHRIKNNLQMIISMMEYARRNLKKENAQAFRRLSEKIHAISALHKHLYMDVHNEKVDLKTYVDDIIGMYNDIPEASYSIKKSIVPVGIPSERMVYFGLILNEMLSNTFEHGNSDGNEISIEVKDHNGNYHFTYQDHSNFDPTQMDGTGTMLIKQLVERVDAKNLKVDGGIGKYEFDFEG